MSFLKSVCFPCGEGLAALWRPSDRSAAAPAAEDADMPFAINKIAWQRKRSSTWSEASTRLSMSSFGSNQLGLSRQLLSRLSVESVDGWLDIEEVAQAKDEIEAEAKVEEGQGQMDEQEEDSEVLEVKKQEPQQEHAEDREITEERNQKQNKRPSRLLMNKDVPTPTKATVQEMQLQTPSSQCSTLYGSSQARSACGASSCGSPSIHSATLDELWCTLQQRQEPRPWNLKPSVGTWRQNLSPKLPPTLLSRREAQQRPSLLEEHNMHPVMYPMSNVFVAGETVVLKPTGAPGAIAFNVLQVLPGGLQLHPNTGVISGVPAEAIAKQSYKVTAWFDNDECTACEFTIGIEPPLPQREDEEQKMQPVMYPESNLFVVGQTVALKPTGARGAIAYTMLQVLPGGLELHPNTGVLSGIPTEASAEQTYKVTAWSDNDDCTACVFTIRIEQHSPQQEEAHLTCCMPASDRAGTWQGFHSSPASQHIQGRMAEGLQAVVYPGSQVYAAGQEVILVPTGARGAIAFSVLHVLPAGLQLHPYTGVISGIPVEATPEATYKVTAWSDDDECTACELTMQIIQS